MQRRRQQTTTAASALTKATVVLALGLVLAARATTAFLLPAPSSPTTTPAANTGMLPRQQSPRQPVAPVAARGKGYGSGGAAGGKGANSGPTAVDGRSLRGYTKALADGAELGAAANSQKAVGPFQVGGEEKFLLLVRRAKPAGAVSAIDANCGRCKFPLLSGKVLEDKSIDAEEEDKEVISCPLCAVTHSLADGRVTGAQATGLLQKVSANFFSKQVATGVKAYEAAAGTDGAVYVKLR